MRLGVLVLSLTLARATYRFIERPGQRWAFLAASSRRTLLAMLSAMTAVILVGGTLEVAGRDVAAADTPPASVTVEECVGPQAMDPEASCAEPFGPAVDVVMG